MPEYCASISPLLNWQLLIILTGAATSLVFKWVLNSHLSNDIGMILQPVKPACGISTLLKLPLQHQPIKACCPHPIFPLPLKTFNLSNLKILMHLLSPGLEPFYLAASHRQIKNILSPRAPTGA